MVILKHKNIFSTLPQTTILGNVCPDPYKINKQRQRRDAQGGSKAFWKKRVDDIFISPLYFIIHLQFS